MLCRTLHLKVVLQAGTILLAAAYTVLLIYHNLGATQQNSRLTDVRWQERGPRSLPGDYDANTVESYNDSKLVIKQSPRVSEVTPRLVNEIVDYATNRKSATTNLDDIFISVKTTRSYHKWRLPVVLKTWFQLAKDQTWFFTDHDDPEFQEKTNGHMINTNCSSSHNRKALCCKMSVEFDVFLESNKKWFCHFDDDNYVNVPKLVKMLNNYNSQQDWYLGKPSMRAPLEIVNKEDSSKISFWFATGGAGFCLSRALALKMIPVASGGKFISVGEKIRLPDDVTMGYIIGGFERASLSCKAGALTTTPTSGCFLLAEGKCPITFQSFTLGKFVSFTTDGCHDGSLQISEVNRPQVGGKWCGTSSGPTIYYSETKTATVTLTLLKLSNEQGGYNFDIRINYKMLVKDTAVVRYGGVTPVPYDRARDRNVTLVYKLPKPVSTAKFFLGELIPGTYCSRIYSDCHTKPCKLQSPNFPGVYPRNLTCYYAVRQNQIPPGKHALIGVRQMKGQFVAIRSRASLYGRTQQQQPSLSPNRELRVWSECDEVQDFITVYDGYTTRDPVLLKFCGTGEPVPETISSGPELLVEFSTSPFGTFVYPTPSQNFHGFQLEVKVYFVDQESPFYTRNKRCEFNLKGTGKGVLESPHHTLSPNTTCSYYLEGTDSIKATPSFRPTPGRYPIQYDPKYWQRQTPPPSPPPPIRYRVWLSVLKFDVAPPLTKTEEDCTVQLQVWDGNLREACNDVFCDKEKGRVTVHPSVVSGKKANATILAQYCRNHIPKTCDHSLLTNYSRVPRPCAITESFLSAGNSMTLQLRLVDSTALRKVSFKALYEFVDLHQDGEAFGSGPCSRKFVSRSQNPMQGFGQKFQSPRDVFLFGRGGNVNLSCVYRFEGQIGERVRINVQNLATGTRPCKSLYHQDINRIRCHGNATAALRVYEYPWPDSLGVPRDCLCSGGDGITPFSFTSSTHIVELRFDLLYMNASDDFRNLHFEGSWEFVRQTVCTREQREKGPSGEIHFRSPNRTPEDINCEFHPWMIEPASGKFLYVKVRGVFIEKDMITYEDVVNNASIASKTAKCETKNRIMVYSGRSVYAVVCPEPSPADKHRVAEVFSEGWIINDSENVPDALLMILDSEKRNRILRARNIIVEYLGKEPGTYKVKWLELSRRKPVLPPEGYVMKDCFHRCPELDACINSSLWCDGVTHCPSGYDESIRHCYEIFQLPVLYLAFGAIGMFCLICAACLLVFRSCRRRAKRRQCRLKTLPSDSSVFEDKEVIC